MNKLLVNVELLKAFGDKSKRIFRPAIAVNTEGLKSFIVYTNIDYASEYYLHIDISGIGVDDPTTIYTGDLKFFANIQNNPFIGNGYMLKDNGITGISFQSIEGKLVLLVQTLEAFSNVAVDIFNYASDDACNVVDKVVFEEFPTNVVITKYNILGAIVINSDTIEGQVGEIFVVDMKSVEQKFFWLYLPDLLEEDKEGVKKNIPQEYSVVEKVNASKWADYLNKYYKITFALGDLKEAFIELGGNTKTEISAPALEINNSVVGFTDYTEDTWVGKVKVNSKGLVTAVEREPELPVASDNTLGGIQVGYEEKVIEKNYPVQLDDNNKAFVHVPWNDTDTWNKVATSEDLGLIKLGYTSEELKYPVQLDGENKAYVEVPWVNTTYSTASKTESGVIKVGYEESDLNYAVKINDDNQAYVTVPWENTTYDIATSDTLGVVKTGLSLTGLYRLPVRSDHEGNLYTINPLYTCENFSSTISIHVGSTKLYFYCVPNEETTSVTIEIANHASIPDSDTRPFTIFINNTLETDLPVKIISAGKKLINMFDTSLLQEEGYTLQSGKSLLLLITIWDNNTATINGNLSL